PGPPEGCRHQDDGQAYRLSFASETSRKEESERRQNSMKMGTSDRNVAIFYRSYGLVAGSSPAGPTNKIGHFLHGWKCPFPNRLRYDANFLVSRSSVDQSIAIKGTQPSNEVP